MKKIGILTFHDNTNYGSWLQTYGLYRYIKSKGYFVEVIDYRRSNRPYTEIITIENLIDIVKNIRTTNFNTIKNVLLTQLNFEIDKRKYWSISSKKYGEKNIIESIEKYDIFLVGSDLVWDIRYADSHVFMLDFINNKKIKISYGASYGYESIPESEKNYIRKYLKDFKEITVRERKNKDELKSILNTNVEYVCDPTMLVENKIWKKFIIKNKRKNKYVLVYMPDKKEKILDSAKQFCRKNHYELIILTKHKKRNGICSHSISEFLNTFYYAEKIFTGSYHGILFSIYFEKEFAYINREPVNRMYSLSEELGIEEYEITNKNFNQESKVDYTKIKNREKRFRKQSKKILENMLKHAVEL